MHTVQDWDSAFSHVWKTRVRLHHFTKRGGLTSNPSLIMPHFIVQFLCQIRSVSG
jgi:hypothetical protein